MQNVALIIFYFFLYSSVGWLVESIYCSIPAKKWINRGFLTGPLCPIYGTGAITMAVILTPLKEKAILLPLFGYQLKITPLLVVLAGMVLCDVVEFITSLLMEKLFHARWWDYSEKPFNIQGRICLGHTMYWGLGALLFMYLVHPLVADLVAYIPMQTIYVLLGVILLIFTADVVNAIYAAMDVKKLMDKLHTLRAKVQDYTDEIRMNYDDISQYSANLRERMAKWRGGAYRGQKEGQLKVNLLLHIKRSRVGRLFFGYPALGEDASRNLEALDDILEELSEEELGQQNGTNKK